MIDFIRKPLISIIIPHYNSGGLILDTLASIFKQTYTSFEVIIIDDISTDESLNLIKSSRYCDKVQIIESKKKLFTAGARNLGMEIATGEFIAFIDSDDYWATSKLENQLNYMLINESKFSFSAFFKVDSFGNVLGKIDVPPSLSYKQLLRGNRICCSSVMISNEILKKYRFDDQIKIVEDYALWLKILREEKIVSSGLNEPLTYYRVHPSAKTKNKFVSARDTWKVLTISEGISPIRAINPFILYAVEGMKKFLIGKIRITKK
jgi:teichuronic acid biosynthesis glycosyltransferase TuaG